MSDAVQAGASPKAPDAGKARPGKGCTLQSARYRRWVAFIGEPAALLMVDEFSTEQRRAHERAGHRTTAAATRRAMTVVART